MSLGGAQCWCGGQLERVERLREPCKRAWRPMHVHVGKSTCSAFVPGNTSHDISPRLAWGSSSARTVGRGGGTLPTHRGGSGCSRWHGLHAPDARDGPITRRGGSGRRGDRSPQSLRGSFGGGELCEEERMQPIIDLLIDLVGGGLNEGNDAGGRGDSHGLTGSRLEIVSLAD